MAGEGLRSRLNRLEQIVAELEREDIELEDALRIFEEGVGHLRAARDVVRRAELQVEQLTSDASVDDAVAAGGAGE